MDENKIPVVEETKNVALEAGNVSGAETTENPVAVENETVDNPSVGEKTALPKSKQAILERLKEIVHNGGEVDRVELEMLKQAFIRLRNAEVDAERKAFVAGGGVEADFVPSADALEKNFKAQVSLIRELRAKAQQAIEKEKEDNLEKKLAILEKIKQMSETPDEADKHYDAVKQLQAEWKEIKSVPAERATELWKNYQLYIENFYDQIRLNHEFRAYDFKKNLEIKTHLCEAAEKLADVEDPVSAFHQLQKLHHEFREVGPVAKELREEIWTRFKNASTVINRRHQNHFEMLKAKEAENLVKKEALCAKVEVLLAKERKTFAEWDEDTKELLAIQAEWKTIGFVPRKVNTKIFERFRALCDEYFQKRGDFAKTIRQARSENVAARVALCEQVEALKDSKDWVGTTQKIVELQKAWKEAGMVNYKEGDALWKRFNSACNTFFERKNEMYLARRKEQDANFREKKALIQEMEQLFANKPSNMLEAVRELQSKWNSIGFVPFVKKEKLNSRYREICDKIFAEIHANSGRRNLDNFKKNVAQKGGNDLVRERMRLLNAFETKKQEIKNYETNLTFFNTKSKSGNHLMDELEGRVERLKKDLDLLAEKINALNEQIQAAENQ